MSGEHWFPPRDETPDDDEPTTAAPAAEKNPGTAKASVATALVRLAVDRYALHATAQDEPFAVPLDGPRVARPLRGGQGSLRAELAAAYFADAGRAASQQALTDALLTLEGIARDGDPVPLHLRVAEHGGGLVLDLGDPTGRAVCLDAAGWRVVERSPVLFRRTAATGALPEPIRGGDLDELWTMLNVAEPDRPLVLAWLLVSGYDLMCRSGYDLTCRASAWAS